MLSMRLLKLRHDRTEIGFLSARLLEEESATESNWQLRVEEPASVEGFRDHLTDGSSMSLGMVTRDGVHLRGEAYVSSISDGMDAARMVALAGTGPLRRA